MVGVKIYLTLNHMQVQVDRSMLHWAVYSYSWVLPAVFLDSLQQSRTFASPDAADAMAEAYGVQLALANLKVGVLDVQPLACHCRAHWCLTILYRV